MVAADSVCREETDTRRSEGVNICVCDWSVCGGGKCVQVQFVIYEWLFCGEGCVCLGVCRSFEGV